jgi:REP element-mobilizing transposase RayT
MATLRQSVSTYAITISTHQSHSHFQLPANAELFIATLFRYRDAGKFKLHGFAIMPGHVHILITPSIDPNTSRCVQLIKADTPSQPENNLPEKSGTLAITNIASETPLTTKPNSHT